MDASAEPIIHGCAVCTEDAVSVCKGCKGTPDAKGGHVAIYYCSAACQKKDWHVHKIQCKVSKNRRTLYRAGDTAQKLFLLYSRNFWTWPIDRVEKGVGLMHSVDVGQSHAGGIWKIFDGQRRPQQAKHYYFPFPKDSFPDAELQEAVLSMGCCSLAIHLMDNLLGSMLKDIDVEVREIETRVKNRCVLLQRVQQGNPVFASARHNVFQISLSNKETYVIDLTAAQYGWQGPAVLPWPVFEAERMDTILEVYEMGGTSKALRATIAKAGKDGEWYQDAMDSAKEAFDHYLREWQRQHISFQTLVKCSEEDFRDKQSKLFDFMDEGMIEARAAVNNRIEAMGVTFW
ncbi:MAG: hypothetical protein Q9186_001552 [Xanthomendoza sp. 1 TL-2023]